MKIKIKTAPCRLDSYAPYPLARPLLVKTKKTILKVKKNKLSTVESFFVKKKNAGFEKLLDFLKKKKTNF